MASGRAISITFAALFVAGCALAPLGATPAAPTSPPSSAGATQSPATPGPDSSADGPLPLCDDVPYISAPESWYRDDPIYVANEMDDDIQTLRGWAAGKPGFVDLWIDRSHHGWITLAFTSDAEARQHELEQEFPDVGVVAVELPVTNAQLQTLQREVSGFLPSLMKNFAVGVQVNKGVVTAEITFLKPEWVEAINARFAGQPVCIGGVDPALAPHEGPQPQSGDGWRLLTDQDGRGEAYRTGIAYDQQSYAHLWAEAQLEGDAPAVDFDSEVAMWFGAVHGSSCPRIRLDDVVVQESLVHSVITYLDVGACTADALPHAYVVALQRSKLPNGPFTIQLESDPPPGGVARTIVDVDLSSPGSVAEPGEIRRQDTSDQPYSVGPGGIIEPDFSTLYRQTAHCGLEWLGPLNEVSWHTDEAHGIDWLPDEWQQSVEDDQMIALEVLITTDPPRLVATANDHSVTYEPSPENRPGCD